MRAPKSLEETIEACRQALRHRRRDGTVPYEHSVLVTHEATLDLAKRLVALEKQVADLNPGKGKEGTDERTDHTA